MNYIVVRMFMGCHFRVWMRSCYVELWVFWRRWGSVQCLRGKLVRRMGLNSFEVIYAAVDSAVAAAMMMMMIM